MIQVIEVVLGYVVKFAVEDGRVYGLTVSTREGVVVLSNLINHLPFGIKEIIVAVAKGVASVTD